MRFVGIDTNGKNLNWHLHSLLAVLLLINEENNLMTCLLELSNHFTYLHKLLLNKVFRLSLKVNDFKHGKVTSTLEVLSNLIWSCDWSITAFLVILFCKIG